MPYDPYDKYELDKCIHLAREYGEQRYKRKAYICIGGEVKMVTDEGYTTMTAAFINRPRDCRYCVVVEPGGKVLLVDMFNLKVHGSNTTLIHKEEETQVFPTVDAAIMCAITTY
jgi:hypothetical protein